MSYNYWKEIRKWKRWKDAEEKQLREFGVSEDIIQRLHTYDWEVFRGERNYQTKLVSWTPDIEYKNVETLELPVKSIEYFLDSIEDMRIFHLLSNVDPLTLQIIFLKIMGYNGHEISHKVGISQKAVNLRLVRLRKKLKKFLN